MSSIVYNVWCAKLILSGQEGTELKSLNFLLGLQSLENTFRIPCASSATKFLVTFDKLSLGQNPNPPHGGRLGMSRVRAHILWKPSEWSFKHSLTGRVLFSASTIPPCISLWAWPLSNLLKLLRAWGFVCQALKSSEEVWLKAFQIQVSISRKLQVWALNSSSSIKGDKVGCAWHRTLFPVEVSSRCPVWASPLGCKQEAQTPSLFW